jgi:hypothetical protein
MTTIQVLYGIDGDSLSAKASMTEVFDCIQVTYLAAVVWLPCAVQCALCCAVVWGACVYGQCVEIKHGHSG